MGNVGVKPDTLADGAINEKTDTVITASDEIIFGDVTDSNNLKKDTVQGILDLVVSDAPSITDNGSSVEAMIISATGEITKPLQPCVLAWAVAQPNKTGNNTTYTMQFTNVIFDQTSDFDGTSTFTTPITGKYLLILRIGWTGLTPATSDSLAITIHTSNRPYAALKEDTNSVEGEGYIDIPVVADLDAADTVTCDWRIGGNGSDAADVRVGYTDLSICLLV